MPTTVFDRKFAFFAQRSRHVICRPSAKLAPATYCVRAILSHKPPQIAAAVCALSSIFSFGLINETKPTRFLTTNKLVLSNHPFSTAPHPTLAPAMRPGRARTAQERFAA